MSEKVTCGVNRAEWPLAGKTIKEVMETVAKMFRISQDSRIIYIVTREIEVACPKVDALHELISKQKSFWSGSRIGLVVVKARLSKQVRSNYKMRTGEELEVLRRSGYKR
jgi:hypothetical protein